MPRADDHQPGREAVHQPWPGTLTGRISAPAAASVSTAARTTASTPGWDRPRRLPSWPAAPAEGLTASQLEAWGAWDQEASLIYDTLSWLPTTSPRQAAWIHQLGILEKERGGRAAAIAIA